MGSAYQQVGERGTAVLFDPRFRRIDLPHSVARLRIDVILRRTFIRFRLLLRTLLVLHLETRYGIVQTIVLSPGVFSTSESTLKSLDGLERSGPLHLFPLLGSIRRLITLRGRLEYLRQRLHLASRLGKRILDTLRRTRQGGFVVAQRAR